MKPQHVVVMATASDTVLVSVQPTVLTAAEARALADILMQQAKKADAMEPEIVAPVTHIVRPS